MDTSEQVVLATLAYYGALRWPLTAIELTEHLIPARRFGREEYTGGVGGVISTVARLVASGRLRSDSGLLVVGDAPIDVVRNRIMRHAESAEKWRAMLRRAWWLQTVPYVRMMCAGGSLAMGSCSAQSDWDMFVIVEKGRLYTARMGLLIAAFALRRLRTKGMRSAPDYFCFNHIITTDGLAIRHRSLYTAQALSWMVPFYDPSGYAARMRQANEWVADYVAKNGTNLFVRRSVPSSRVLGIIRRCAELMLNTVIGGFTEQLLRHWMRRRISHNPATGARGGRIVADDRELEFHPDSFEAVALRRYHAALAHLGMHRFTERDSGLVS